MDIKGKNVIITGAASGLGKKLAEYIHPVASRLIAIDRNTNELKKLQKDSGDKMEIITANLDKSQSLKNLFSKLEKKKIRYDLLINCAGTGSHDKIKDLRLDTIQSLIGVNSVAPIALTSYLISKNLLADKSTIVNIGSISGDLILPNMSLYAASKALLHSFTRSASIELKKQGKKNLLVILGSLKGTNFGKNLNSGVRRFKFYEQLKTTTEEATQAIIEAIKKDKSELVHPSYLKIILFTERYLPKITSILKDLTYQFLYKS